MRGLKGRSYRHNLNDCYRWLLHQLSQTEKRRRRSLEEEESKGQKEETPPVLHLQGHKRRSYTLVQALSVVPQSATGGASCLMAYCACCVCTGLCARRKVCDVRLSAGRHEPVGDCQRESPSVERHPDGGTTSHSVTHSSGHTPTAGAVC